MFLSTHQTDSTGNMAQQQQHRFPVHAAQYRYALIITLAVLAFASSEVALPVPAVTAWIPTPATTRISSGRIHRATTCCRMAAMGHRDGDKDNGNDVVTPFATTTTTTTKTRRKFVVESTTTAMASIGTATAITTGAAIANADDAVVDWEASNTTPLSSTSPSSSSSSAIVLPEMGLGAWAWGDALFWGYDKKNDEELRKVFDYAVQSNPVTLLDTAEVYGLGRSETLIGEFAQPYPTEKIQIATKFAALPWRTKAMDVVNACEKSLARLNGRPIDLYQIHFPGAWSNEEYWDGLGMAYERGLVKAVGVSNYGVDAVTACHAALAKRGIPLTSNQIQLSLLYPYALQNGLMEKCKELNVKVLSYSPLALGMLGGKYTADNKPSGPRKAVYEKLMTTSDYSNLISTMNDIAKNHKTKDGIAPTTTAQVALNWARAKGSIPIPGARTLSQVQSNYNALQWDLTNDEVQMLDDAAAKVTTFIQPDVSPFPRQDKNTGLIMFDS